MSLQRLLVNVADFCRRHALSVVAAGVLCAVLAVLYTYGHLGVTTDTSAMFSSRLPWRQSANELARDFPQFDNVLVVAIKAAEPEEGEATAAALADKLAQDRTVITDVARPDASPFLRKEGLLFLDTQAADRPDGPDHRRAALPRPACRRPAARGLFAALALLGDRA